MAEFVRRFHFRISGGVLERVGCLPCNHFITKLQQCVGLKGLYFDYQASVSVFVSRDDVEIQNKSRLSTTLYLKMSLIYFNLEEFTGKSRRDFAVVWSNVYKAKLLIYHQGAGTTIINRIATSNKRCRYVH